MQSGCKGEGKAAGTAYRRQKLCGEKEQGYDASEEPVWERI